MMKLLAILLAAGSLAQQPQYPPSFPPKPSLPSSINYAPSVTPNIQDPTAPNAQDVCSGYTASNVKETSVGVTADLTIAGNKCQVYGTDVENLVLQVQYQSQQRLNVKIYPKYLVASNQSQYILSDYLTPSGKQESGCSSGNSDLKFVWTNTPDFAFKIVRNSNGDTIFSTYGKKLVFENQFLELATTLPDDANIYGLAGTLRGYRLLNDNYTVTYWNAYNLDYDLALDVNGHDTHPMYVETRYGTNGSLSHGVYARNAHGQEFLFRTGSLTYRTLGGSFDLYFLSGSTPSQVISQYQMGIVQTPVLQPYWALGYFQNRWSYQNWSNLQAVIDAFHDSDIQLEGVVNDLDYLYLNRIFTLNPVQYNQDEGVIFLNRLHANGQYYLPILDPNVYVPNPNNASDDYAPYHRGAELNAYIRNGDNFYVGVEWPGFVVWPDFLVPQAQQFWTEQIQSFHQRLKFDGFWLDVNDAVSYCTYSCGEHLITENPIHVPFPLPGDPNSAQAVNFQYPEAFMVTNATEAASASAQLASQSLHYPTPPPQATPTPTYPRTRVTPGVRNLNFPPYAINANCNPGNSLVKQAIAPNATHQDGPYNSTEYELHNLYGHLSGRATYNGLVSTLSGRRPYYMSRSTFAGSGAFAGHWGQDGESTWGNMYFSISQALQFSIAGIPFFGVETCGFRQNADLELCTRWMQLSAWFPNYRNHNSRNTIAQEPYRWETNIESTRTIMSIRYSLLPYTYTLFYKANKAGETVMRALQWEFPDDPQLKAIETQFMSGPAFLITPVLNPLVTTVQGVFPGVAQGTRWYDYYTLAQVNAAPGENKTLSAPITYQNIHVRGGYIVPIQKAGNTTQTSRQSPWSLLVALDKNQAAVGELYLDDGINLRQVATKYITMSFSNNVLTTTPQGNFKDNLPLANITLAGLSSKPTSVQVTLDGKQQNTNGVKLTYSNTGALYITGLQQATQSGVWNSQLKVVLK